MTQKRSAGVLLHCTVEGEPQVLLVHPGGPFWRGKDAGAWRIPKGLAEPGEDEEASARRETAEELGIAIEGPLMPLGTIRQAGGKTVIAFTAERDVEPESVISNTVEVEWPRRSGRKI